MNTLMIGSLKLKVCDSDTPWKLTTEQRLEKSIQSLLQERQIHLDRFARAAEVSLKHQENIQDYELVESWDPEKRSISWRFLKRS